MDKQPDLTIFTSTYNRAHLLGRLYSSLLRQEGEIFEWLIIDDGSTDNTREKVMGWIAQGRIPIRYYYIKHGGKHRAINYGLEVSKGRYAFFVDSDDWLTDNALSIVSKYLKTTDEREDIIGLQFRTMNASGRMIGNSLPKKVFITDMISLREKERIKGDMAEIFKIDIFREKFRFPEIEGEDFMPEAIIWNRMSTNYKVLFIDRPIYYVEYQKDGLSAKIVEKRHNSPRGAMLFYSELAQNSDIPLYRRWRAAINYWRFAVSEALISEEEKKKVFPHLSVFGRIMKKRDLSKIIRGNKPGTK